jgi:hypothetical protein
MFEPRVQGQFNAWEQCRYDEDSAAEEVPRIAQTLSDLVHDTLTSEVERVEAIFILGMVMLAHTHRADSEQTERALAFLRQANEQRNCLMTKDPTGSAAAQLAGSFGSFLSRHADRAPIDEQDALIKEADDALRNAIDLSPSTDAGLVERNANLASHILKFHIPGAAAAIDEAQQRSENALQLAVAVRRPDYKLASLWRLVGHVRRQRWLHEATTDRPRLDLYKSAADAYSTSDTKAAGSADTACTESAIDWAILHRDLFDLTGDTAALASAITLATAAIDELEDDDVYRPEASMQLAECFLARYGHSRDESDIRAALKFSEAAIESYYLPRHGRAHHVFKWRRLEILRELTGVPGSWDPEFREMRQLLDEASQTDQIRPTAEIACIRLLDDIRKQIAGLPDADCISAACSLADDLRIVVTTSAFRTRPLIWCARYAQTEMDIYERCNYFGLSQG